MRERTLIDRITSSITSSGPIEVGPGDDLAVLDIPAGRIVFGTDVITEGVDFERLEGGRSGYAYKVGRKAALVNLSDIAAMGASPVCMVVGATMRKGTDESCVNGILDGLLSIHRGYGLQLAGGDISSTDGPTSLAAAVLGRLSGKPLLRSGARPGDLLIVTGSLGGSILGKHLDFTPRLEEGRYLAENEYASSCIDVSDGLGTDARHIAEASGVRVEITGAAIPVSVDARALASKDGVSTMRHALADGEDFELLFTVSEGKIGKLFSEWPFETPVTIIGKVWEKRPGEEAAKAMVVTSDGESVPADEGYEHEF